MINKILRFWNTHHKLRRFVVAFSNEITLMFGSWFVLFLLVPDYMAKSGYNWQAYLFFPVEALTILFGVIAITAFLGLYFRKAWLWIISFTLSFGLFMLFGTTYFLNQRTLGGIFLYTLAYIFVSRAIDYNPTDLLGPRRLTFKIQNTRKRIV